MRRRQRRPLEALRCAERALQLEPGNVVACHLCAELLRHQNRSTEALRVLRALPAEVTRNEQHLLLEGGLQMALGQWQDAAVTFLGLLALKPAHIEAYQQLGFALANLGQHADASECFRTVSMLEPQLGSAIYSAHYSAWACDWEKVAEDESRLSASMSLIGAGAPGYSPFCLLSLNDDAAMHRHAAEVAARHLAKEARSGQFDGAWVAPDPGPAGYPVVMANPKIRIGFVSADFRTHATSLLLVRTLERMDRGRFELTLYSHGGNDASPLRKRLEAAVDHFVECREMSTAAQAQRVRADGIAILVDMSGYTAQSRLAMFALRPAPVQVLWLAYPSTTGADFMDYLIGDPVLTPLAHAADFTERIAQLPVCYEPTDELRDHPPTSTRAAAGLPEHAFVYACFNQSYKITEPVFSGWCRILQQVQGSVLWLLVPQPGIRAALLAQAAQRGIGPERIVFAPFVAPLEHLARLPLADLFLDTFPYGAHTTCSDALWMGLPVLTRVGRSFFSPGGCEPAACGAGCPIWPRLPSAAAYEASCGAAMRTTIPRRCATWRCAPTCQISGSRCRCSTMHVSAPNWRTLFDAHARAAGSKAWRPRHVARFLIAFLESPMYLENPCVVAQCSYMGVPKSPLITYLSETVRAARRSTSCSRACFAPISASTATTMPLEAGSTMLDVGLHNHPIQTVSKHLRSSRKKWATDPVGVLAARPSPAHRSADLTKVLEQATPMSVLKLRGGAGTGPRRRARFGLNLREQCTNCVRSLDVGTRWSRSRRMDSRSSDARHPPDRWRRTDRTVCDFRCGP